jgi:hypothetical protein
MPDITMCEGLECPLKENCYRYTATPNEHRQSYFAEIPYKDGKCEYHWGSSTQSLWEQLVEIFKPDNESDN